jgi:signal recognition particle GTPase
VNRLLKQFVQMRKMLKQLGAMQGGGKRGGMIGMLRGRR